MEVFVGVSVHAFAAGERLRSRRWDEHGRLEVVTWKPTSGPGFLLGYRDGKLLGFEHYLGGKEM